MSMLVHGDNWTHLRRGYRAVGGNIDLVGCRRFHC